MQAISDIALVFGDAVAEHTGQVKLLLTGLMDTELQSLDEARLGALAADVAACLTFSGFLNDAEILARLLLSVFSPGSFADPAVLSGLLEEDGGDNGEEEGQTENYPEKISQVLSVFLPALPRQGEKGRRLLSASVGPLLGLVTEGTVAKAKEGGDEAAVLVRVEDMVKHLMFLLTVEAPPGTVTDISAATTSAAPSAGGQCKERGVKNVEGETEEVEEEDKKEEKENQETACLSEEDVFSAAAGCLWLCITHELQCCVGQGGLEALSVCFAKSLAALPLPEHDQGLLKVLRERVEQVVESVKGVKEARALARIVNKLYETLVAVDLTPGQGYRCFSVSVSVARS
ncbi:unnamed protein product [Discosporangium mesarthrocarpum]